MPKRRVPIYDCCRNSPIGKRDQNRSTAGRHWQRATGLSAARLYFQYLQRSKRAMTLNLKGLEAFERLAGKADVVVDSVRPDVKTKFGIDYESLRKIIPRFVNG